MKRSSLVSTLFALLASSNAWAIGPEEMCQEVMKDDFFSDYADAVIMDSGCVDGDCTDLPAILETSVGIRIVNLGDDAFPIDLLERYVSTAASEISDAVPVKFSFDPGQLDSVIFFVVIDNSASSKLSEIYSEEGERSLFISDVAPLLEAGKCTGYASTVINQGTRMVKQANIFIPNDMIDHSQIKSCALNFTFGASGMFGSFDDLTTVREGVTLEHKKSAKEYSTREMALLKFHYDFAAQSTPDVVALMENYCASQ